MKNDTFDLMKKYYNKLSISLKNIIINFRSHEIWSHDHFPIESLVEIIKCQFF
jgi:hypothetical protein